MDTASIRASDREREVAASRLREHAAEGRLSVDELVTRLEATFAATTRGELEALFGDLPRKADSGASGRRRAHRWPQARIYLAVSLLMILIWASTGMGYFWPAWPMLGWGIGVVVSCRGRTRSRVPRLTPP